MLEFKPKEKIFLFLRMATSVTCQLTKNQMDVHCLPSGQRDRGRQSRKKNERKSVGRTTDLWCTEKTDATSDPSFTSVFFRLLLILIINSFLSVCVCVCVCVCTRVCSGHAHAAAGCGTSVSRPGIKPRRQRWEHWILATRPPGNSLSRVLFCCL